MLHSITLSSTNVEVLHNIVSLRYLNFVIHRFFYKSILIGFKGLSKSRFLFFLLNAALPPKTLDESKVISRVQSTLKYFGHKRLITCKNSVPHLRFKTGSCCTCRVIIGCSNMTIHFMTIMMMALALWCFSIYGVICTLLECSVKQILTSDAKPAS